jgi:hypothetical protein
MTQETLKAAVRTIITGEIDLETKLDLLTSITVACRQETLTQVCEELREELCSGFVQTGREDILRSVKKPTFTESHPDSGTEESP